jgi:hypothetical protein
MNGLNIAGAERRDVVAGFLVATVFLATAFSFRSVSDALMRVTLAVLVDVFFVLATLVILLPN